MKGKDGGGVARWLELIMHRLNEKCNKKNINNSSNSKDLWSSVFEGVCESPISLFVIVVAILCRYWCVAFLFIRMGECARFC